jgi:thiol-disulfide isomerase/thioredoxin
MRTVALFVALAAVIASGGCGRTSAPASPDAFRLLDVADVEELTTHLDSLEARAVVVNVWATWCGPCIVEFPEFMRFDTEMAEQGVEVRFLSVDDPAIRPRVVQFLRQRGWNEPSYLALSQDVVQGLSFGAHTIWDGSIPTTFVLVDGKVRDMWVGTTTYQLLAARVDRVLAPPPAEQAASL